MITLTFLCISIRINKQQVLKFSKVIQIYEQVLVLGTPLVEYFYCDEKISINVCFQFENEADRLANKFPCIRSTYSNVTENLNYFAELQ